MTVRLTHDEIRELLAAHALDAVERDEAETIELHLRDCPRCRAEVADYREVASALAAGHEPAPMRLWDNIMSELEAAPPMKLASVVPIRSVPWRKSLRVGIGAVATVAAAALTLLSVRVLEQDERIDSMQSALTDKTILAAAITANGNPNSRHAELRSANGVLLARATLGPDGTGYLWSDGLPRTDADRTYQLWAIVGTESISIGVLGSSPNIAPFRIAGDVVGLAITEEVTGGVVATKNQPVAFGLIVTA